MEGHALVISNRVYGAGDSGNVSFETDSSSWGSTSRILPTFFFVASSAADLGSFMAASARRRSVSRSSHAMRAKVVSTRRRGFVL